MVGLLCSVLAACGGGLLEEPESAVPSSAVLVAAQLPHVVRGQSSSDAPTQFPRQSQAAVAEIEPGQTHFEEEATDGVFDVTILD